MTDRLTESSEVGEGFADGEAGGAGCCCFGGEHGAEAYMKAVPSTAPMSPVSQALQRRLAAVDGPPWLRHRNSRFRLRFKPESPGIPEARRC